ncbi:BON domain-containing protein [Hydrogenophaga sp. T2]|uniref:BON domain-containing protein n=1 Tax=Hydrogenophaga sp. T2 TaxID=3132823 RepID=UPI003CEB8215
MNLKRLPRIGTTLLATVALSTLMSACAPLVIGGAAVGTLMAVDRRSSGAQVDDQAIELRAANRLRDTLGGRANVSVNSYNRQVLLTGEVNSEATRAEAEKIVAGVDNVRSIVNELKVMNSPGLSQRTSDSLITGRVKAGFVDARDLPVTNIKVTTANGVVYLMGRVTQKEADRATEVARNTEGVQRVVRIFEVLSEEELQRLAPAPAAQPGTGTGSGTEAPRQ